VLRQGRNLPDDRSPPPWPSAFASPRRRADRAIAKRNIRPGLVRLVMADPRRSAGGGFCEFLGGLIRLDLCAQQNITNADAHCNKRYPESNSFREQGLYAAGKDAVRSFSSSGHKRLLHVLLHLFVLNSVDGCRPKPKSNVGCLSRAEPRIGILTIRGRIRKIRLGRAGSSRSWIAWGTTVLRRREP
jgi:hypothetical protein